MGYFYENSTYDVRVADGVVTTPTGTLALSQVVTVRVQKGGVNLEVDSTTVVGRTLELGFAWLLVLGFFATGVREFVEGLNSRSLASLGWGVLLLGGSVFLHQAWIQQTPFWAVVADTAAGPKLVARCWTEQGAAEVRAGLEGGMRAPAGRPEVGD